MQLTYRGKTYEYNPPAIETRASSEGGKYRGQDWRFRNLKKPPVLQPTRNLVYRGVAYTTGGELAAKTEPNSVAQQSRRLFWGYERSDRDRQQAMHNRAAAEIGFQG
ncbi:MAG: DUF4278 domain-containing protein [Jaaginema sp. PMC 1079.18]|nr:DUF4278 domain-containing protein [Jaaginema sp. PMC 1080.18]MEC4852751.1 DUF4278 domain-containing protein [Jaaginema sp. PMC 1079.18]MEC4868328.1 DUF4278 domain-containing protein [Jaaginema sp. PMC 1078.18]